MIRTWSLFAVVVPGLALLALLIPAAEAKIDVPPSVDVIVYGSTPAGFCAAIGAAREGARVLLLEPTAHVGGVNTGGLSFSDSNQTVRAALGGLFEEWHLRIEKDYTDRGVTLPYKVSVKDHTHWTYEPHVAMRVTRQLLEEAGVRVLTKQTLKSVQKQDGRIAHLVCTNGNTFGARTYVDATYEGDLMAAAGVSWTIGRESRKELDEKYAGVRFSKPLMAISGFDDRGKLLPLVTTADGGNEGDGDRNVMIYSFRLCLTKEADNRVPFPKPAKYDPARFEAVRRYFRQEPRPIVLWDLYPLPGKKFDANNGIGKQFSMGLIGGCNGWSEDDAAGREKKWEEHKQYILELYQFLTTDPAVPEHLQKVLAELGLCRDEFPETGHWSPQLYVREGRRMRGAYFLTEHDVLTNLEKPDAIAISSFPIDSHDCQRVARKDGGVLSEGTIFPVKPGGRKHGPPMQVPYRAITPKADECTNLLVPVAISASHVAYSSIRVEPTWMTIGHSAGIAAALAAKEKVAVQKLPYETLRAALLGQKQVLVAPELPPVPVSSGPAGLDPKSLPGIVIDETEAKADGPWSHSTTFQPYVWKGYLHDDRRGDGQSTLTFRVTPPKTGRYELKIAYSPHATRAKNIPVTVRSGGASTDFVFDETVPLPAGGRFRTAGTVALNAADEATVTISNRRTDGFVIVDAIQLLEAKE
ncbi:Xanthan lyase precursor [Caulifigura coniformis]|uniref:Xanthan lyase n=1 Tax=Caulifigura coniformis TaxID=2527983 RepID=A0A517SB70_9PLAN|nr:FAD-dependent oxidoreductase [Caulifigura coniformis]QDT53359.1 Xanthan lyase precursor [Caulifigura coniformis]